MPRWLTRRYPFELKDNYLFMNGSLGFSSGCLIFTALYRILPEAAKFLSQSNYSSNYKQTLVAAFIAGIGACVFFNQILHYLTSESVVHCSHGGDDESISEGHSDSHVNKKHDSLPLHPHNHLHLHLHLHLSESSSLHHSHEHSHLEAETPDRPPSFVGEGPTELDPLLIRKKLTGILHLFSPEDGEEEILGECRGLSSAELCLHELNTLHFCEIPTLRKVDTEDGRSTELGLRHGDIYDHRSTHNSIHGEEHHHHHVNSPFSRLFLIGVQTILAITLHKFPEGFITYVTLETNPELGFSIFLSLLIHNFTEGFAMCLPLYYAFTNVRWRKTWAVCISAALGFCSQPLGALAGYFFIQKYGTGEEVDMGRLNYVFGILMSVTCGFLCVIAMLMYGLAISFSGKPNFVLVWCLSGMCIIGLSSIYSSH